jgi:hypothetical protein
MHGLDCIVPLKQGCRHQGATVAPHYLRSTQHKEAAQRNTSSKGPYCSHTQEPPSQVLSSRRSTSTPRPTPPMPSDLNNFEECTGV